MPAIILQNHEAEMLGALLISGAEELADGQTRDCVLTGVPRNPALLDDPLCVVVQENKHVEFPATIARQGQDIGISVPIRPDLVVAVRLAPDRTGEWLVEDERGLSPGKCILAGKT